MVQKRSQLHWENGEKANADSVAQTLAAFVPDLTDWPRSWRYEDRDVVPGEQIVACLTPFLHHLLGLGLSRKTRNRHRDNLWRLGGELIRAIQEEPRLRRQPINVVVGSVVGQDGGPLLANSDSEEVQSSFDSTCRKLAAFLRDTAINHTD